MIIDPTPSLDPNQAASQNLNRVNKSAGNAGGATSFSTVLNQAIQSAASSANAGTTSGTAAPVNTAANGTASANQAANTADLFNMLMQSQLNSMFSNSLDSTSGANSFTGLGNGLLGGAGNTSSLLTLLTEAAMSQGTQTNGAGNSSTGNTGLSSLLSANLLPLLLGSMTNLGGTAGIGMIGSQLPMGTLSTPVITSTPFSAPNMAVSSNLPPSGVSKATIQSWIDQYAPQYGLNPKLVNAVITQESGYSPSATSSAGAMGLMQLMPETAATLGVSNPYDPLSNLLGGMKYLSELMNHYQGNLPLALAAYNAGSNAVTEYGGIPPYPETQRYVTDIMALMNH